MASNGRGDPTLLDCHPAAESFCVLADRPLNIAKTFARQRYDYALIRRLEPMIEGNSGYRKGPTGEMTFRRADGALVAAPLGDSVRLGGSL
jgi:hypothetical protein